MGTQNSDAMNTGGAAGTKLDSIKVNDSKAPGRSSNWAGSSSRGKQGQEG